MQILQPPDWPRPKGYSNGIAAQGKMVFVAGQIGWDRNEYILSDNLAEQVRQTLLNTVAVLAEAGARPEHVTRMTWYILDKQEYQSSLKDIGRVYRDIMGNNYPAMAMLQVSALIEEQAKVEIETTAVIPD
ncbi:MAG: RidA family protein [Gammaproteobacteria bacterium]|nr:RidA family protein [Gammaproteobacteria bacterium]